jgi:hypothetical protein
LMVEPLWQLIDRSLLKHDVEEAANESVFSR